MKKVITLFAGFCLLLFVFQACERTILVGPMPEPLNLVLPALPYEYPDYQKVAKAVGHEVNSGGQRVRVTDAGAQLGRVLFYDPQLSLNNRISCSSCHHQATGFADNKPFSEGIRGLKTSRNSMAIVNINGSNNLFWDSRARSLNDLALMPVRDHIEMGIENTGDLEIKLAAIEYYPDLFIKAFGTNKITEDRIAEALSQFMASMVAFDTKFDRGIKQNFSNFNDLEKMGKELFFSTKTQCSSCHSGLDFSAPDFPGGAYSSPSRVGTANIGLDIVYKDNGRKDGQFKIPTLRNIALTAPYMHDGRFKSLSEVIDHYNNGVSAHHNLDTALRNGNQPRRLGLNPFEKQALIAFLMTLTDESFVQDPRYSNPFKY